MNSYNYTIDTLIQFLSDIQGIKITKVEAIISSNATALLPTIKSNLANDYILEKIATQTSSGNVYRTD